MAADAPQHCEGPLRGSRAFAAPAHCRAYEVLTAFPVVAVSTRVCRRPRPFAVRNRGARPQDERGLPRGPCRSRSSAPVDRIDRTDSSSHDDLAVEEKRWETGTSPELVAWMQRMHGRRARCLCSACTGGSGFWRETGLLDGRQATTHWAFGPGFRAFPDCRICAWTRSLVHRRRPRGNSPVRAGARPRCRSRPLPDRSLRQPRRPRGRSRSSSCSGGHAEGHAPYLPVPLPTGKPASPPTGRRPFWAALQDWAGHEFRPVASPVTEMTSMIGTVAPRAFERRFKRARGFPHPATSISVALDEGGTQVGADRLPIDQISWESATRTRQRSGAWFSMRIARVTPGFYRRKFPRQQAHVAVQSKPNRLGNGRHHRSS